MKTDTEIYEFFQKKRACSDALNWLAENDITSFKEAWNTCPDPYWIAWALAHIKHEPGAFLVWTFEILLDTLEIKRYPREYILRFKRAYSAWLSNSLTKEIRVNVEIIADSYNKCHKHQLTGHYGINVFLHTLMLDPKWSVNSAVMAIRTIDSRISLCDLSDKIRQYVPFPSEEDINRAVKEAA